MSLLDNNGLSYLWGKIKGYVGGQLPSDFTGATTASAGLHGLVPAPTAADTEKFLQANGSWGDGGKPMVILSYGNSTWADFIDAYNHNVIVYCRASSNSNPATGSQTRLGFMAYVNNAETPTEVEFQYYRSVSSHSATQQGDQVYIYKLTKTGGWTVTTRESYTKIIGGTNTTTTYNNGALTINATDTDTWRNISVNGVEKLGTAKTTGSVGFINGLNTTVTYDDTNRTIQIDADSGSSTDEKVAQNATTANAEYRILLSGTDDDEDHIEGAYKSGGFRFNPSIYSVSEGYETSALGEYSHTEGRGTLTTTAMTHAEGYNTYARSVCSHAEGEASTSWGYGSHAEGFHSYTNAAYSHAEGYRSYANGYRAHAEGYYTTANANNAHAEGDSTRALASNSHTEGEGTYASGAEAHAEGYLSSATTMYAHAEGWGCIASGRNAHAEGAYAYATTINAHAEGSQTRAIGDTSHAEGYLTTSSGACSHVEGRNSIASGERAHAQNWGTTASGMASHAEGENTLASTICTHAEGFTTKAIYPYAHAEGYNSRAAGKYSHAEGLGTTTSNSSAHAEGQYSLASGDYGAHAEGQETTAKGNNSHAEGNRTIATHVSQHVFGEYNALDASTAVGDNRGTYVEIVGNGLGSTQRSNARTLDWEGNEVLSGKLTVGTAPTNDMDVATKKYVDDAVTAAIAQVLAAQY